jgi:hypothetical protein
MIAIACLLYLALIALVGYAAMSMLLGPQRWPLAQIIGYSFASGCGGVSLFLFAASLMGIAPNIPALIVLAAIAAVAMFVMYSSSALIRPRFKSGQKSSFTWWSGLTLVAGLLILFSSASVAVTSLTAGLADIDAFGNWVFKAKVLAYEPLRPIPSSFLDPSLSYSHQDYPLSMPLLVSGMYAAEGGVNEQAGKAILLPAYLSLAAILYAALRPINGRAIAMAITAAMVTAPIVVQHAGMPVGEPFLLLYFTASVCLLLRWMDSNDWRDLIACTAFAAFAAFAKNEGLSLLPMIGVASLLYVVMKPSTVTRASGPGEEPSNAEAPLSPEKHARAGGPCHNDRFRPLVGWFVAVLLITPWLIYRSYLPRTHEDYGGKLMSLSTLVHDLPRLRYVLPAFFEQILEIQNAGLLWLLLGLSALIGWRAFRQQRVLVLWGLLIAHLGLYVVTFMVTPWDLNELLPMISPKLLMHASPTAALLIGLHLSSTRSTSHTSDLSVPAS